MSIRTSMSEVKCLARANKAMEPMAKNISDIKEHGCRPHGGGIPGRRQTDVGGMVVPLTNRGILPTLSKTPWSNGLVTRSCFQSECIGQYRPKQRFSTEFFQSSTPKCRRNVPMKAKLSAGQVLAGGNTRDRVSIE